MGKRRVDLSAPDRAKPLPSSLTERNQRRRRRKAHEKAWKAQTSWEGCAAHGMPKMRRMANKLARYHRQEMIRVRRRARAK